MVTLLVVLSILSFIGGLFSLTKATLGVGLIAGACFGGILARMFQAQIHYEDGKEFLVSKFSESEKQKILDD